MNAICGIIDREPEEPCASSVAGQCAASGDYTAVQEAPSEDHIAKQKGFAVDKYYTVRGNGRIFKLISFDTSCIPEFAKLID